MNSTKSDRELIQDLLLEIKTLRKENEALKERVRDLEEKINTNSRNSSKPPSQDPNRKRKGSRRASGKKPGAQEGHEGSSRSMLPPERVSEFKDIFPQSCPHCQGEDFAQSSLAIEHRQETELPEIQAQITQFNIHTCACQDCGMSVKAKIPKEALSAFGPRLKGFISLLTGDLGVTKRKVVSLMGHLNITISLGSVCKIHHLAGEILADPYEMLCQKTLSQQAIHSDETSWYCKGKRQWLWIITGHEGACFKIHPSRGSSAFQSILGDCTQTQVLTTDRYSVYSAYEGPKQYCWSHLDRDFEKIAEREDIDRKIGQRLKEDADEVFLYWRYFQESLLTRRELQKHMEVFVIAPVKALLILASQGEGCSAKTRGTCKRILSGFECLWRYLYHKGVEPTNNLAERDLRPSVIQRKLSYGTQSEAGNIFTERILTVVVSFKKQAKDTFKYLVSCFDAHSRDAPIPSPL